MAILGNRSPGNRRSAESLAKLSRSPTIGRFAVFNHFARVVDSLAPTSKFPKLSAFLPKRLWQWIWPVLKYSFSRKYPFQNYNQSKKNGVYKIAPSADSDRIQIAIAGDWGTGTDQAFDITKQMAATNPDITIHLGDVYYIGDLPEIEEKCLGQRTDGYDGVNWPHGKQGSFALNGNHEMYANGGPYFCRFLKTLGMNGDAEGQVASFFCLETDHWRILGIDTGYNSVGVPILGNIPLIKRISFIGADCHLENDLMDWLRKTVKIAENPKPMLLLSHHQYFTAFPNEDEYPKPATQLAEFLQGQDIVWIWGHEHRLGFYDKHRTTEGITFYGRCVGHGGMPVDLAVPDASKAPLILYDGDEKRAYALDDGTKVGRNGFVKLTIAGPVVELDYRDIENISLLVEEFTPNASGALTHTLKNPGILTAP